MTKVEIDNHGPLLNNYLATIKSKKTSFFHAPFYQKLHRAKLAAGVYAEPWKIYAFWVAIS